MNNIILNQSDCYKSCNNVSCDAATTEYGDGITEFVDCEFDGTIYIKTLNEGSEKIIWLTGRDSGTDHVLCQF